MPTPRLSVLISTKDYARFLPEAIGSVQRQTLSRAAWELIVVDDGSVDDTAAVVRQFGDDVRYFYQDNAGQAAALNRAVREARGEFIALLDADDRFYEAKLERVLAKFESGPNLGMVHHRLDVVNERGERLRTAPFRARLDEGWLRDQLIRYGGTWNAFVTAATSALAFRRRELEAVLPIPETEFRTMADGYLVTQMALRQPVGAIHESLGAYRLHGQNHWATSELTAETVRRRQLTPLARVSELVAARLPETVDVDVTRDRVYVEYLCLAEKMDGRWARALGRCGTLARALRHDARLGACDKLWRWLHAVALLALPVCCYTQLKHWYTRHPSAYRLRRKWLAIKQETPAYGSV